MERLSHCPLDCPDACSLRVEVIDGRVATVDGTDANPITSGYICAKVRALPDHMYGEERLLHPAIRVGAKGEASFRRASWDEALELIARRFGELSSEHGAECILPLSYGGSNGLLTQDTTDARLWRRMGASNLARTVCAVPTTRAATSMYGKMPGVPYLDYPRAELIVVWGCNPGASGIHLLPYIQQARRNGARLVVVDPRRNRLARQADLHLAVRPGSDGSVALAIASWLFEHGHADEAFLSEHCREVDEFRDRATRWSLAEAAEVAGIDAAEIETLARWYAQASPALIRAGWGMERNRNGCSSVAAVLALPAVAGKFGVRGGGYTLSNSGAFVLDPTVAANEPASSARTLNMNRLGRYLAELDNPPIHGLFVYNHNPIATLPEQERVIAGLRREDLFTVVFEQVMTESARYADVLLPATVFLEHEELRGGYGATVLQSSPPVVQAAGEARPNYRVFAELCDRLGLSRDDDSREPADLQTRILGGNGTGAALARDGIVEADLGDGIQMRGIKPRTPDGLIHLIPSDLDAEAPDGLFGFRPDPATEAYPLALLSAATKHTINSTLGQLRRGQEPLRIHPDDADARTITDGDRVRVFNDLGEVQCHAHVTRAVRPGVLFLPKGIWDHQTLNGRTSNALVPDDYTDVGEGACFNDARVQVELLA